MVSAALLVTGAVLVVAGGYGARYPQRQYEIRQWGQTDDTPELNATGKLLWRILDLVLVALGIGTLWLAFTL